MIFWLPDKANNLQQVTVFHWASCTTFALEQEWTIYLEGPHLLLIFNLNIIFFFFCKTYFFIFLYTGSLVLYGAFSSYSAWVSHCRSFSYGAWALGHEGFSSCGTWALVCCSMCDLPGPGIKPMFPALTGELLFTGPPGKFCSFFFFMILSQR